MKKEEDFAVDVKAILLSYKNLPDELQQQINDFLLSLSVLPESHGKEQ
jgi:hypothetical protein